MSTITTRASKGAALSWDEADANFININTKASETISVMDFGAVGDGVTDDTVALQAALNSGAKVISLVGKIIVAGQVTIPSGVSLVGDGGTLKAKTGIYYQILIPNGSSDTTIDNVIFDATELITAGSPTGETACIASATTSGTMTGLRITNNNFLNIPTGLGQRIHAVQISYGTALVSGNYTPQCGGDIYNFNNGYYIVVNNTANNGGDGGIAFNNVARGIIANNHIFKCDLGIGAGPEGSDAYPEHSMIISGNEIIACDNGINMGWFTYAGKQAPRCVSVIGNTIDKCKSSAIRYDGASITSVAYLTIVGNIISYCGATDYDSTVGAGYGLIINNAKYTSISSNAFRDNLSADITTNAFPDVVISSNVFNAGVATSDYAIDCNSSGALINNNVLYGRGILVDAAYVRVNSNSMRGVAGSAGSNTGAVVVTSAGANSQINNNTMIDCGVGIYMPSLAGWVSADQVDNSFVNCTITVYQSPLPREGDAYVECYYTGTVDGSNNLDIVHGFGAWAPYRVVLAQAFVKGGSGEGVALTLAFVDGTKVRFTGGTSGDIARAYLRINKDAAAW